MSGFTPSVKAQFEFEGDMVEVILTRLKRKDFQQWSQHMKIDDSGVVKMTFSDQLQMSEVLTSLLPTYVKSFSGLKAADGSPLELTAVLEEVYFNNLIAQIIKKLFEISNLGKDDVKNSVGSSGDISKA